MTAGFPCVPIMRPHLCWTVLHVSILAVLLLASNADTEDCAVELKVRRNTVHEASLGSNLRINCTVSFCNDSPPAVSWFRHEKYTVPVNVSRGSHIKTEWKKFNSSEGISYLIFQNILISDSGVYQCQAGGSVGHNINVSVYGQVNSTDAWNVTRNVTNSTIPPLEPKENIWMYVYTATGIVIFVILVIIISVVSMQGCKGKSKKETRIDNQYMAIPMDERPFPRAGPQASPKASPSALPSQRSTRRKPLPSQPSEVPLPREDEHLYSMVKEDRQRQGASVEEEGSSLVYAALNHQLPAGAPARPRRPKEECSEYAAIRVKDH